MNDKKMSGISKEFKDWACSFYGCDGGNPAANVWLCGIEYGNAEKDENENQKYYENLLSNKENEIDAKYNFFNRENPTNKCNMEYRGFNQNFAKIYNAYLGNKAEDYENLLNSDNEILKLNLYPIAFKNTSEELWKKYKLDEITGFENKHLYMTWCFFNRSKIFRKLREKHNPKLIVCVGTSYLLDFMMFFSQCDNTDNSEYLHSKELTPISDKNKKYTRTYYYLRTDETLLVVIPFISGSPAGLNSYYLWNKMGKNIRKLLNENK